MEPRGLRSPVGCLVVALVLSIISVGLISATAYIAFPQRYGTVLDAITWGVGGSIFLLLATLITGIVVARRRHAPLTTPAVVGLGTLLGVGVVFAYLSLVVMGL
jgi:hypothetical protein